MPQGNSRCMSPGALLPHGRVIAGEMRCGAIPIRLVHALEVGGAVLVQFAQCLSNNVHMAIGIDAAGNGNPNQIDFGIVNHALLILIINADAPNSETRTPDFM